MSHITRVSGFTFKQLFFHYLLLGALIVICVSPALAKKQGSGDFNGDGYADLCIGVPFDKVGSVTQAGSANCIYGSASGLEASGNPRAAQLWTRDAPANSDHFGWAVAVGDFNGDGYDDLCVGIPNETVAGNSGEGAVNCIYGSATGLQSQGVGGPASQRWDNSNTGMRLTRPFGFGLSLTAGDFNRDGYADLCIGAPAGGTDFFAGEVLCLYGSANGLQATGSGAPLPQMWNQSTPGLGEVPGNSEFGWSLVAGDFNGDGFDDLCVGASEDLLDLSGDLGSVTCIYGSIFGLQANAKGGVASQYWHPGVSSLKGPLGTYQNFGFSLAVGDFNHDGYPDLAIGSPEDEPSTGFASGSGEVNVLYGSPTGLQDTGTGAPDDQLWSRDSPGVKGGSGKGMAFGYALTAGDFNHDGFDDLCVGAPFASGHAKNGGAVNCLYGSGTGLQATGTGGPASQLWNQESDGVIGTTEEGDNFGAALSVGDFNGDGNLDLAIGVPGENSAAGAINVLYGSTTGLQATGTGGPNDQFWRQASDGVPGSGGGLFGWSLSQ
jgi:FG-GAP repeat